MAGGSAAAAQAGRTSAATGRSAWTRSPAHCSARATTRSSTTSRTTRPATPAGTARTIVRRRQRRAARRRHARLRRGAQPRVRSACRCCPPARRCSSWARRSAPRSCTGTTTSSTTREDIVGERAGIGATRLFRFYQDLITLSGRLRSVRSRDIDILHQSNENRVVAFTRWDGSEQTDRRGEPEQRSVCTATRSRHGPTAPGRRLEGDLQQRRGDVRRPERRQRRRHAPCLRRKHRRDDSGQRARGARQAVTCPARQASHPKAG